GQEGGFRRIRQGIADRQTRSRLIDPLRAEPGVPKARVWRVGVKTGVHVRRGRHAARIELLYLLRVAEDVRKLPGEQLLLVPGELEIGERGDALHLRDAERCGHANECYHAPARLPCEVMVLRSSSGIGSMRDLRRAAVAGTWYPGTRETLAATVDAHVAHVTELSEACPRAIVAPHAGLMYSGPVAAYAYKPVATCRYSAIVLVGPSHFVGFQGVSIWPRGAWDTPFGTVAVAEDIAAAM